MVVLISGRLGNIAGVVHDKENIGTRLQQSVISVDCSENLVLIGSAS